MGEWWGEGEPHPNFAPSCWRCWWLIMGAAAFDEEEGGEGEGVPERAAAAPID